MILLNYGHPLTEEQVARVAALAGETPEMRSLAAHADRSRPMKELARELVDAAELTSAEWQTVTLLVNPPGLVPLALALVAEMHGRCGYFPAILNIRPATGTIQLYEVAEIVSLQQLRDEARVRRNDA